jgi:hypothetical protein
MPRKSIIMSNTNQIIRLSKPTLFEKMFHPNNGFKFFLVAIGAAYGIIPFSVTLLVPEVRFFGLLSAITSLSVLAMYVGNSVPVFDRRFRISAPRFIVSTRGFVTIVWLIFLVFNLITFATAPTIPIFSALTGADANALSQQRGDFLKGREGIGIILLYISTFMNTIVPYSIVLLYQERAKMRHLAALIFFVYAISFMAKALFLNMILPILAFLAINQRLRGKTATCLVMGSLILLFGMTFLSLRGEATADGNGDFFTALYAPADPLTFFLWRSIGVPIFTATDTLAVHAEQFGGRLLMGATSSLVASMTGLERINLERFVFEHQFGSWNEIANSNAVFIVDAFVNFGWTGVFIFGFVVGQVFRWFRLSDDKAFTAQWSVFAFLLFSSPLIGMLLSNGWAYVIFHALFIRVRSNVTKHPT